MIFSVINRKSNMTVNIQNIDAINQFDLFK